MTKPQPPADLWAQLDTAIKEVESAPKHPANAFTIAELVQKKNYTYDKAEYWLKKLKKAGKIKRVGGSSRFGYYVFIG